MVPASACPDGGQAVIVTIVFVCLAMLATTFFIMIPYGAATDAKSRSRTAADAAALAGADAVREWWVDDATMPGIGRLPYWTPVPRPPSGGEGRASAEDYASRNGASLTEYTVVLPDEVRVEVRNDDVAYGAADRARSEATAEMDVDFGACVWVGPPPVPPPPGVTPPPFPAELRCGPWSAGYEIVWSGSSYWADSRLAGSDRDRVYDALLPRLSE